MQAFRRLPPVAQMAAATALIVLLWLGTNFAFQVLRKPSELFFPVSGALYKTPTETWDEYGDVFRAHATHVITADLLAALAQVEGLGQSGGADLLALVVSPQAVRSVPAGIERGRHVPDHGWNVRRGEALLRP